MKKVLFFLLTLLLPFFLFLELWGNYRYHLLQDEIAALETEQLEWIEKNKQILSGIAEKNSPERIKELAEEELGLEQKESWDKAKIRVRAKEEE